MSAGIQKTPVESQPTFYRIECNSKDLQSHLF